MMFLLKLKVFYIFTSIVFFIYILRLNNKIFFNISIVNSILFFIKKYIYI